VTTIPAETHMGAVELSVGDLARSLRYYREAIGLQVLDERDGHVSLGAGGRELLRLVEEPGAQPVHHNSGLFHFALLVPSRVDLARWLAHAGREGVQLTGASDHVVSEALYLRDPDHHGIEIYADRPRETWEGQVAAKITSIPLDLGDIVAELDDPAEPFAGLADGTTMGHVHLRVRDVPETIAFYRDTLGFDLMAEIPRQAAFLSAGGYHHHLGANTWESAGQGQAPPGHATLRRFTVVLPSEAERDEVAGRLAAEDTNAGPLARDPSGNAFLLAA
jgi:catechol 2,3-dioxygenase